MKLRSIQGIWNSTRSWSTGRFARGFSVTLELAYRCNLRCVFCSRWDEPEDLSLEVISQIAEDMSSLGADYVSLSGGDPFVRKDIERIIDVFVEHRVPIHINTNGVLLRRYAEFLKSRAEAIVGITVSMDSTVPDEHDRIRGVQGTYRKMLAGMEAVRASIPVALACTLTQINIGDIEAYADFARRHGYPFRFQPVHDDADNQLAPNQDGVTVEPEFLENLTARLEATLTPADRFPRRQYYRLFEPFFRNDPRLKRLRCVAAARSVYFVDPKGGVYPCDTRRDIELGNVYKERLRNIVTGERSTDWRNACRDGRNGCWCMYACVAPTNVRNQFLPIVPATRTGWPVERRWRDFLDAGWSKPADDEQQPIAPTPAPPSLIDDWPSVSVVVASYNGGATVERCLRSTFDIDYPESRFEVVLVDDGSDDGSITAVRTDFSDEISRGTLQIVESGVPTGVPAAYNRGVEASEVSSRYILKLDNDVAPLPDALRRLVACAELNPTAGIVGGTVYYRQQPDRVQFAGSFLRSPWRGPEKLHSPFNDHPPVNSDLPIEVDLIGSCMALIRREVFEQAGMFPEEYGRYEYEDYDFAFHARHFGFKSLYCPGALVYHDVSASSRGNDLSKLRARLRVRNGLLFMWRFTPRSWHWRYAAYNLAKLPFDVVRGRLPLGPALLGWADGIKTIRSPNAERRLLQAAAVEPSRPR